jgi:hypothetical protein
MAAKPYGANMLDTEEYLIRTADRCIQLARAGREMAASLEAMSNELMAKAVELDTVRDRKQKRVGKAGDA